MYRDDADRERVFGTGTACDAEVLDEHRSELLECCWPQAAHLPLAAEMVDQPCSSLAVVVNRSLRQIIRVQLFLFRRQGVVTELPQRTAVRDIDGRRLAILEVWSFAVEPLQRGVAVAEIPPRAERIMAFQDFWFQLS